MPTVADRTLQLRDSARSHHRAGNLAAAIADYEALLRDNPADADCLGLLAMTLHQSGQHDLARAKWRECLSLPAEPPIKLRNLNNFIATVIAKGATPDAATLKLISVPDWSAGQVPSAAEKDLIISVARGLSQIGKRDDALRLIDGTTRFAVGDLIFARNLAEILIEAGQAEKARQLLAANEMQDGEWLLARAGAAYAAGRHEEAVQLTREAAAALPVHMTAAGPGQQYLIGVITPAPLIVTTIMSPQLFHFSANSPANLALKHNDLYRFWSVFPEAPDAAAADKLPRAALILNNWVNGERLSTPDTLDFIAGFADRFELPVLNHPRQAALATRQRNAKRLSDIPGLVVPRIARFHNAPEKRRDVIRAITDTIGFPVIIRDPFRQMGKAAEKIDSAEALATHLAGQAAIQLYAIQFIDNPVAGGLFRKIRAAVIGDEVIIAHVHFGARWNVHRERDAASAAEVSVPPGEQAFAQSILFKPEEALGRTGIAALRAIRERIPLDFYGIDFDILPDGRLVFFEANAAMNVSMTGRKTKGVEPIRARMREAFHRLIATTAGSAPAG
jgi:tetratricopeptide (TPR) repeat protein